MMAIRAQRDRPIPTGTFCCYDPRLGRIDQGDLGEASSSASSPDGPERRVIDQRRRATSRKSIFITRVHEAIPSVYRSRGKTRPRKANIRAVDATLTDTTEEDGRKQIKAGLHDEIINGDSGVKMDRWDRTCPCETVLKKANETKDDLVRPNKLPRKVPESFKAKRSGGPSCRRDALQS
uniref:Uncharacterized protein n=1 Tax=Steinernema glaseri TaxID=37863 RepID=A0A1I8ARF9_9BILA